MLTKMYVRFQNKMASDEGATMAEYGLLIALVGVLLIGAITVFKDALDALFREVAAAL